MEYVEFRRVRKTLTIFACVILGLAILAFIGIKLSTVGSTNGQATFIIDSANLKHPAGPAALGRVRVPLGMILGIAGYVAIVCATVFSSSLSKENDGADFAFTKPISRERLALRYMAIDATAILVVFVVAATVGFLTLAALGLLGRITTDGQSYWIGALGLAVAFMWYGLLQAVTASYTGKQGILVGISWGVWGVLVGVASFPYLGPIVLGFVHVLNFFNPLAYFTALVSSGDVATVQSEIDLPIAARVALSSLLGFAGCVLAIRLWKRVEA